MNTGIMLSALDSVASVLGSCSVAGCGKKDVELSGFDNAESLL